MQNERVNKLSNDVKITDIKKRPLEKVLYSVIYLLSGSVILRVIYSEYWV